MSVIAKHQVQERTYLPKSYKISVWSKLKPYFSELLKREIASLEDLETWILNWCELNDVVAEEFRWRYIRFTCNNDDEKAVASYNYAVQELTPRISPYSDALNRRLLESPFCKTLDKKKYFIFLRSIRNAIDLYRENNIALISEVKVRAKEHGRIFSQMMVELNGEELTLQQANARMEGAPRKEREMIYQKISSRLREDANELDNVFDDLLQLRNQLAVNADYDNYRDYKFQELARFDYKVDDCLDFHKAIASEIVPLVNELNAVRKSALKVDKLRPWDTMVDISGKTPIQPFNDVEELVTKTMTSLSHLNPMFGEVIEIMNEKGHLDLDSRKGKRPGGYNMPLPISGIPFIFMNSANSIKDMRTMMHESGHAVHAYLISKYRLSASKSLPSEIAELAAMTMELLSMDYWDTFFEDKEMLRRAKIWQLEKVLTTLPWVATIDKFQHWLYTNPEHSAHERTESWNRIFKEFRSTIVDWDGLDKNIEYMWHRQLHIFEVPFYYIEYGMAQLGAIAIWRQYRENPQQAVNNYINALSLGYTKPIPEIYEAAGIEFNFSQSYVSELGAFVKKELEALLFE